MLDTLSGIRVLNVGEVSTVLLTSPQFLRYKCAFNVYLELIIPNYLSPLVRCFILIFFLIHLSYPENFGSNEPTPYFHHADQGQALWCLSGDYI